ncbi:Uma2 family endonuclease [Rhodopseudomonas rhenobacensis]|uniref:Uma2 family endonuclease n=1 Tax=Rhodopseudomonas rhenobacensis TaxID=87461 RepID=A0A7W7YZU4_9BRAD|nr:Uma2 family endonuclease [Rhodopseudomonas rhenobacensis]MBB5045358.1 Uma2 family endonuclease [Rhodopseudomonas rhenobacensis]
MRPSHIPKIAPEAFFAWIAGREGRYELVDGEVVMMAGAGRRHDHIVVNLITALNLQTRGGRCQTFTGDTYVATSPATRRMPDLGVDCGTTDDASLVADRPSLVVEVLSPTTGGIDVTIKLAEYQSLPTLDYILLVDTASPKVHFHYRAEDRIWTAIVVEGLDAAIRLDKLEVRLELRDIYAGLEFRPKPKLVEPASEACEPGGSDP